MITEPAVEIACVVKSVKSACDVGLKGVVGKIDCMNVVALRPDVDCIVVRQSQHRDVEFGDEG